MGASIILAGWLLATGGYVVDGKLTCQAMGLCDDPVLPDVACGLYPCEQERPAVVQCAGIWKFEHENGEMRLRCARPSEREI